MNISYTAPHFEKVENLTPLFIKEVLGEIFEIPLNTPFIKGDNERREFERGKTRGGNLKRGKNVGRIW